ncbi:MAG: hypothetical protein LC663_05730 [Actinobacteria bacterium]|nr:hypothetical protein [Actinomycetota bacterium]
MDELPEVSTSSTETSPPQESSKRRDARAQLTDFLKRNLRLLVVVGILVCGIVFVMLGWYGTAHTNIITEQIPYLISGGLLGLGLIILAGILATSWMQQRATDDLRVELARALANSRPMSSADIGPVPSSNGHSVYSLAGGKSFHAAGCPLLEGKENVKQLQPAQASAAGLAPCKLCEPQ